MPLYTNQFKGRANRREKAKHFRDEFDRIEAAFNTMEARLVRTISTVYVVTVNTDVVTLDPANGLYQEMTITGDVTIQVQDPSGPEDPNRRVILTVHGANHIIENGWGPQTWKDIGQNDWLYLKTGSGPYSSALLEFWWDGSAWICISFTRNELLTGNTSEITTTNFSFPLIYTLDDAEGSETLGFTRASPGTGFDNNLNWHTFHDDEPRFTGARYVRNWVADASDLTSAAWDASGVTVATESSAGPSGEDVSKLTFNSNGSELRHWFLPHFGRSSGTADGLKVAVSFKAKMASVSAGNMRVVACLMANDNYSSPVHERIAVALNDEWQTFGYVFDVVASGGTGWAYNLANSTKRTLTKVAFEHPSGGLGDPVLLTDVQVEWLREEEDAIPGEFQESSFGSSLTLAATSGSTGSWDNGTKVMTLTAGQYVDFQDSLEIGKAYLCVPVLNSGNSADVRMDDDRVFWAAYNSAGNNGVGFVSAAPFSFLYDGGVFKFDLANGASANYTINIYEISDEFSAYGRMNASTINASTKVLTYAEGAPVSSGIADGLVYEKETTGNLIPATHFRSFYNWDTNTLVTGADALGAQSSFRGEYGIDGYPCRGTLLQDKRTGAVGYIEHSFTISDDSDQYYFTFWVRRTFDGQGNQTVTPQYNGVASPASKFIDFEFALEGGSTEIVGERIRLNLSALTSSVPSSYAYEEYGVLNVNKWLRVRLALQNNGTGNTSARCRIYPAAADVAQRTVTDASVTGWVIVDWAQLEENNGTIARSPIHGGVTREPDEITTSLSDSPLYNEVFSDVGDITSGDFVFDESGIYRSITAADAETTEVITDFEGRSMHEFGPLYEDCEENLLDEDGEDILSEGGLEICTETLIPIEYTLYVAIYHENVGDMTLVKFDGADWNAIGSSYDTPSNRRAWIAAVNDTQVAMVDSSTDRIRMLEFDGSGWAQVGNDIHTGEGQPYGICYLTENTVAIIGSDTDYLRAYEWDGVDTWSYLGGTDLGSLSFPSVGWIADNRVVCFLDTEEFAIFDWNGSSFTQVGNSYTGFSWSSDKGGCRYNETQFVMACGSGGVRMFEFDGTNIVQVGSTYNVTTNSIAYMGENRFARSSTSGTYFLTLIEWDGSSFTQVGNVWAGPYPNGNQNSVTDLFYETDPESI